MKTIKHIAIVFLLVILTGCTGWQRTGFASWEYPVSYEEVYDK